MIKFLSFTAAISIGMFWVLYPLNSSAQTTTTYTYDAKGRMVSAAPASGPTETIVFDDANNITNIDVSGGNSNPPTNSPPVCDDISVTVIGFSYSGPFAEFLAALSCTDPDGDALSGSAVTQPGNGAVVSIVGDNILVEMVPSGNTVFTRTVTDDEGGSVVSSVTVVN